MKKKSQYHSVWIPVSVTILSSLIVFVAAEYIFHIPSRFMTDIQPYTGETEWTPRQIVNPPPPPSPPTSPISTGALDAPVACTMEYAPVCGADGRDYSNECMAKASGTTVTSNGNCKDIPTATGTTNIVATVSGERDMSLYQTGYHIYENKTFGYTVALPKFAYYAGLAGRDGANHALLVGLTATGVDNIELADVVVYFYKKTPSTPPEGQPVQIQNGTIYVANQNTSGNPKIQKILDTIFESIQSVQ